MADDDDTASSPLLFFHDFPETLPEHHSALIACQQLDGLWFFGNVLATTISACPPPFLSSLLSPYRSIELMEARTADDGLVSATMRCAAGSFGCSQDSIQDASLSHQIDELVTSDTEELQGEEQKLELVAKEMKKGKGTRSKSMTRLEPQHSTQAMRFGSGLGVNLVADDSSRVRTKGQLLRWRLPVSMEEAANMKEHLKFWARAVATTVRQEC